MASTSSLWVSKAFPLYSTLQAMRAIGQSGGEFVAMHPRRGIGQPLSEAELSPVLWSHQQNLGGLDEESSQITAASLG
jgi:hypothetical protein